MIDDKWQAFVKSGKIEDYLAYASSLQNSNPNNSIRNYDLEKNSKEDKASSASLSEKGNCSNGDNVC